SEITELHHVGAARADGGDLLDGDHRVHERAALAAIGLGQANAHETVRAHQFRDVKRIARVVRTLEHILFEMRERETANRVGEGLLLFGEVELHLEYPQTRLCWESSLASRIWVPAMGSRIAGCPSWRRAEDHCSFRVDADGFYQVGPHRQLAIDDGGVVLGRGGLRLDALHS